MGSARLIVAAVTKLNCATSLHPSTSSPRALIRCRVVEQVVEMQAHSPSSPHVNVILPRQLSPFLPARLWPEFDRRQGKAKWLPSGRILSVFISTVRRPGACCAQHT